MQETNRQRLERLGMMDDETIDFLTEGILCNYCRFGATNGVMSIGPNGPTFCEGMYCDQAIERWLNDETDEEDDPRDL